MIPAKEALYETNPREARYLALDDHISVPSGEGWHATTLFSTRDRSLLTLNHIFVGFGLLLTCRHTLPC